MPNACSFSRNLLLAPRDQKVACAKLPSELLYAARDLQKSRKQQKVSFGCLPCVFKKTSFSHGVSAKNGPWNLPGIAQGGSTNALAGSRQPECSSRRGETLVFLKNMRLASTRASVPPFVDAIFTCPSLGWAALG